MAGRICFHQMIINMNARLAVEENERLIQELISQAAKIQERLEMSIEDSIDYLTKVNVKFAKTENEKAVWELRGYYAKEKIKI